MGVTFVIFHAREEQLVPGEAFWPLPKDAKRADTAAPLNLIAEPSLQLLFKGGNNLQLDPLSMCTFWCHSGKSE